jgi:hypothetical protein
VWELSWYRTAPSMEWAAQDAGIELGERQGVCETAVSSSMSGMQHIRGYNPQDQDALRARRKLACIVLQFCASKACCLIMRCLCFATTQQVLHTQQRLCYTFCVEPLVSNL